MPFGKRSYALMKLTSKNRIINIIFANKMETKIDKKSLARFSLKTARFVVKIFYKSIKAMIKIILFFGAAYYIIKKNSHKLKTFYEAKRENLRRK
ncbi:MAG: hypothetical protein M1355_04150 [Patescibacteria group bacterium]|nr:hypothetical protein [Patescibacteria group bacterium]